MGKFKSIMTTELNDYQKQINKMKKRDKLALIKAKNKKNN